MTTKKNQQQKKQDRINTYYEQIMQVIKACNAPLGASSKASGGGGGGGGNGQLEDDLIEPDAFTWRHLAGAKGD